MKLKKIVSLALASLMAVSMLAACGEGSSSSTPETEVPTTPTGYSKDVWDNLDKAAQSNVKYADSAELNDALQTAMGFVAHDNIAAGYDWNLRNTLTYVTDGSDPTYGVTDPAVANVLVVALADLIDTMDAENEVSDQQTQAFDRLNPYVDADLGTIVYDDTKAEEDDLNTTIMYVVDGGVSYNAVMQQVADAIEADMKKLQDDYTNDNVPAATLVTYDYEYTLSVSAYTTTLDADHGKSLTFVAVNVDRDFKVA